MQMDYILSTNGLLKVYAVANNYCSCIGEMQNCSEGDALKEASRIFSSWLDYMHGK